MRGGGQPLLDFGDSAAGRIGDVRVLCICKGAQRHECALATARTQYVDGTKLVRLAALRLGQNEGCPGFFEGPLNPGLRLCRDQFLQRGENAYIACSEDFGGRLYPLCRISCAELQGAERCLDDTAHAVVDAHTLGAIRPTVEFLVRDQFEVSFAVAISCVARGDVHVDAALGERIENGRRMRDAGCRDFVHGLDRVCV